MSSINLYKFWLVPAELAEKILGTLSPQLRSPFKRQGLLSDANGLGRTRRRDFLSDGRFGRGLRAPQNPAGEPRRLIGGRGHTS